MTLVEFLRARLAEDRAAAERARDVPTSFGVEDSAVDEFARLARNEGARGEVEEHIVRHDPARVLAQVAATERIVDLMEQEDAAGSGLTDADGLSRSIRAIAVLRLLAAPFVDHSDYDESWKP